MAMQLLGARASQLKDMVEVIMTFHWCYGKAGLLILSCILVLLPVIFLKSRSNHIPPQLNTLQ